MTSTPRCLLLVPLLLMVALPADAYRREYRVLLEGGRKAGSEVCFYRGDDSKNPFALFFASSEVRCLPADQVLDFPPGVFHAFARHRDGYVSAYRDYFVYRGEAVPEAGYEELDIPLDRAGYADFGDVLGALRPGQFVGVWLAPTKATQGTFFRLVMGEHRIMVPANNPFVSLLIENGVPIRIGLPMRVAAGETANVKPFAARAPNGSSDVVAWTHLDRGSATNATDALKPPEVRLTGTGFTRDPLFPFYDGRATTNSFVFFKDVPAGDAELRVRGATWLPIDRRIVIRSGDPTIEKEPLPLTVAATITLQWQPREGVAISDCPVTDVDRPQIRATLARCGRPAMATGQKDICTNVATSSADYASGGVLQFQQRDPGSYRITVERPYGGDVVLPVQLTAGAEATLRVPIEPFSFFGTVKLNGIPLRNATLIFESGEARTDEIGHYTATLAGNPLANIVSIVGCEDGRRVRYIPTAGPLPNTAFDIELRSQSLGVTVLDETGKPASGASVSFSPQMDAATHSAYYTSPALVTGKAGMVTFPDLPTEKPVVICVSLAPRSTKCGQPLERAVLASGEVVIKLDPIGFRGTIAGHEGHGSLFWVDPNGHVTETAMIEPSGKFAFRNPHTPIEHIVYVGDQRPLAVLAIAPDWQASTDLNLTLPAVPVVAFTVRVAARQQRPRWVGLWVGKDYVPLEALAMHQEMRGNDVRVSGAEPLPIRDIAVTAPLSVAAAPDPEPEPKQFVDIYTLPENAHVRRFAVTGPVVTTEP